MKTVYRTKKIHYHNLRLIIRLTSKARSLERIRRHSQWLPLNDYPPHELRSIVATPSASYQV
jgi:hypothetical protein